MGKMGSICHFPRALPASIWGHCSQVLVFTSIWGTQKGFLQWHFSCCFSQHLGILGPPNTAKQEKTQNDKWTLFCPPTCIGPGSCYRALGLPYRAISSRYGPSVPLMGGPFSCQNVGHSPGLNCIGPQGASKNTLVIKMITCNYFCFGELIFWWLQLQLHFLIPSRIDSREM